MRKALLFAAVLLLSAAAEAQIWVSVPAAWVRMDGGDPSSGSSGLPLAPSLGDMIYYNGSAWVSLPVGSNTNVLTLAAGLPSWAAPSGGGVTDADYIVGTAHAGLSAEIVAGTSPGGELGGTWASPTLDDSVTVASWTLTSPTITTPVMTHTKNIMLYPSRAQFLATAFPQYVVFAGTNFPVESLKFDTTTEEAAFWQFEAEDYASGNLTLKVYWYADTSVTAAATVEWEVSITAITGDADTTNVETDTLATSQVQSDTLGTTDAQKLQITTVTITNLDSIAAGDLIFLRLARNVGGTDDMAGDAQVIQAKLSYTANF